MDGDDDCSIMRERGKIFQSNALEDIIFVIGTKFCSIVVSKDSMLVTYVYVLLVKHCMYVCYSGYDPHLHTNIEDNRWIFF